MMFRRRQLDVIEPGTEESEPLHSVRIIEPDSPSVNQVLNAATLARINEIEARDELEWLRRHMRKMIDSLWYASMMHHTNAPNHHGQLWTDCDMPACQKSSEVLFDVEQRLRG